MDREHTVTGIICIKGENINHELVVESVRYGQIGRRGLLWDQHIFLRFVAKAHVQREISDNGKPGELEKG